MEQVVIDYGTQLACGGRYKGTTAPIFSSRVCELNLPTTYSNSIILHSLPYGSVLHRMELWTADLEPLDWQYIYFVMLKHKTDGKFYSVLNSVDYQVLDTNYVSWAGDPALPTIVNLWDEFDKLELRQFNLNKAYLGLEVVITNASNPARLISKVSFGVQNDPKYGPIDHELRSPDEWEVLNYGYK